MIFWITLIALAVFAVLAVVFFDSWYFEWVSMLSIIISVTAGIAFVIMLIVVIANNVGIEASIEANKQRYESLVYQAENNLYENDNDLGKKDLVNQIQEWNEDLARGKILQDDFWVGIFTILCGEEIFIFALCNIKGNNKHFTPRIFLDFCVHNLGNITACGQRLTAT